MQYYNLAGVQNYTNPLANDGALIHAVNVTSYPYGAKSKRTGYSAFLGTADGQQVNSLFAFGKNDGTTLFVYRASGSLLSYSSQGTADWATAGNGTIAAGAHFGNAILDNTLIGGDGQGSTRHTTTGTAFTNTTLAPPGEFFEEYQRRIYIGGTSSTLFYSTTNDATNWNTSGTSDSNSLTIPGAGKLGRIYKTSDQLITTKNSGLMHKWDGLSLIDMGTKFGPSSPYAVAKAEDYPFFLNQLGIYGQGGAKPTILSNAIQRQFYNDSATGIAGTVFATIPAEVHRYDYLASVGTVTDDFTKRTIPNAIIKYDFQKNEYVNWNFANKPTAFLSYRDATNTQQLIFGDATGQCYKMDTSTTDNGAAIESEMVFLFTYGAPEFAKKWNYWRGFFNPGCEAKIQVASSDTLEYTHLTWSELGDATSGFCEVRFPDNNRSHFLFVRIYESSKNSRYTFYGQEISAELIKRQ